MLPLPTLSNVTTGITEALSPDGFISRILLGLFSYAGEPGDWLKLPGALSVIYASLFLIWQIGKLIATMLEDELGFRDLRIRRRADSPKSDFSTTNFSEYRTAYQQTSQQADNHEPEVPVSYSSEAPTADQQTSQQVDNHEPEVPVSYSSEAPTADQQTSQQDDDEERPAALEHVVTDSSESSTIARQRQIDDVEEPSGSSQKPSKQENMTSKSSSSAGGRRL
jgi:hypothetical protein